MSNQESKPLECRGEYSGYEHCMKAGHVALTTSENEANKETSFRSMSGDYRRVQSDLGKLVYGFSIKRFPECNTPRWLSAARFVYDAPLFDLGVLLYPRLGTAQPYPSPWDTYWIRSGHGTRAIPYPITKTRVTESIKEKFQASRGNSERVSNRLGPLLTQDDTKC